MNNFLALLRFLLIGAACVSPALASDKMPSSDFKQQYWSGAAYSDSGSFSYCVMTAKYQNTFLAFGLNKDFSDFMISVASDDWSLPEGQTLYATIGIDDYAGGSYDGIVVTSHQITFHMKIDDPRVITKLTISKKLTIKTSKLSMPFNLLAIDKAMSALLNCVAERVSRNKSNPFEN